MTTRVLVAGIFALLLAHSSTSYVARGTDFNRVPSETKWSTGHARKPFIAKILERDQAPKFNSLRNTPRQVQKPTPSKNPRLPRLPYTSHQEMTPNPTLSIGPMKPSAYIKDGEEVDDYFPEPNGQNDIDDEAWTSMGEQIQTAKLTGQTEINSDELGDEKPSRLTDELTRNTKHALRADFEDNEDSETVEDPSALTSIQDQIRRTNGDYEESTDEEISDETPTPVLIEYGRTTVDQDEVREQEIPPSGTFSADIATGRPVTLEFNMRAEQPAITRSSGSSAHIAQAESAWTPASSHSKASYADVHVFNDANRAVNLNGMASSRRFGDFISETAYPSYPTPSPEDSWISGIISPDQPQVYMTETPAPMPTFPDRGLKLRAHLGRGYLRQASTFEDDLNFAGLDENTDVNPSSSSDDSIKPSFSDAGDIDPSASEDEFEPSASPDDFEPSGSPDDFDPSGSPEDFDPSGSPDDFDPSESPDDFDPSGSPDDFDPSSSPDDFDPSGSPDDFDPSESPDDFSESSDPESSESPNAPCELATLFDINMLRNRPEFQKVLLELIVEGPGLNRRCDYGQRTSDNMVGLMAANTFTNSRAWLLTEVNTVEAPATVAVTYVAYSKEISLDLFNTSLLPYVFDKGETGLVRGMQENGEDITRVSFQRLPAVLSVEDQDNSRGLTVGEGAAIVVGSALVLGLALFIGSELAGQTAAGAA